MIVKQSFHALIIDDEPGVRALIADVLTSDGWSVSEAETAADALVQMERREWSLVFCDVVLGGPDGYSVLRQFSDLQPGARFILMTGHGSAAGALDATSTGAYDYLLKPFTVDDILRISGVINEQLRNRKSRPKQADGVLEGYESDLPLVGTAPKFVECLKVVGRVAGTSLPVLITGESGTGKEVVARAIHQRSKRAAFRFVTVNCGAIPTELIESELFGHARGSFTGADRERVGIWEEATGGTLFLDEITETNSLFQVKLLRALQEGEIRRVGSNRTIKVDVRVVAASNCDIEAEVAQGRFRQDLMYRLNAVTVNLPPLRERQEDIAILAEYFVATVGGLGSTRRYFSSEALEMMRNYSWPGNIRELENAVLHAVSLSDDQIYPEHLPAKIRSSAAGGPANSGPALNPSETGPDTGEKKWATLAEMEQKYVTEVLAHSNGNKQSASRILNIDRKTLARIINRNPSSE